MIGLRSITVSLLPLLLLVSTSLAVAQSNNSGRPWGPGHWPPDENPRFFPVGVFGGWDGGRMAGYFAWYLRSMAEKPMPDCLGPEHPQVYRVLVLPPYGSRLLVRLSVTTGGSAELTAKVGQSDWHPEVLIVDKTMEVSNADVESFLKRLNDAAFWSVPAEDPRHDVMGGVVWLIEGAKAGEYHVVDRPDSELGPLKDSAVFLTVRLGKVDLPTRPPHK